jgi:hypothetical protein
VQALFQRAKGRSAHLDQQRRAAGTKACVGCDGSTNVKDGKVRGKFNLRFLRSRTGMSAALSHRIHPHCGK